DHPVLRGPGPRSRWARERADPTMRVLVLGAGVVGMATAYYLWRDGHEVTVVERNAGAAGETSFGNAGGLCPSFAGPWAAPWAGAMR
ncbi:FAD-dependent oxidoreductase, partial [Klebsiella pneumoniae]|uniref:FAD-dependent oxidoreductase n=1 Tax=Klebsiella pneumoniae TaxID=573 RepID=UPI00359C40BF